MNPSRPHEARGTTAGNGNDIKADEDILGLQASHNGDEEEPSSKELKKPGIVIIHRRTVFRDCLALCLQTAYVDHDVLSFSSIAEWLGSRNQSTFDAVIIVVIDAINESSTADLELLKTNAVANPVVIVSDTDDLNHIVRILKSGVRGYIPTSLSFNVAVEALRLVKAGGVFIPASSFVPGDDEPLMGVRNSALLTERQMKVVEEIRHGKANKQIAYELKMSEHTVKVHLRHIMRKLKARNRTEVAVLSETLFSGFKETPKESPVAKSNGDTHTK
ncbi:response regulator transcription factor [Bradyrhizobium lablabi]|uniref:response regulator transcription factor n=1 Tax=Bradyrhizobium lablabi TaxID=722472 RepID=UPI001BAB1892|nr:response regulator transcription factor [Bradyrhizobium lablabi]MBR1121931.1 response regulator transcription factor [Bradyrhizobium lablabi]